MTRRRFLRWLGTLTLLPLSGCANGMSDGQPTQIPPATATVTPTRTEATAAASKSTAEQETAGSELVIEYELSVLSQDEVPDRVIEHPSPEGFEWVAVRFELISGKFDAGAILGLTQVATGDESHFTRAVLLTEPEEIDLLNTGGSHAISAGAVGTAYYRVPTATTIDDPQWVVEQLDNQYDVETRERTAG